MAFAHQALRKCEVFLVTENWELQGNPDQSALLEINLHRQDPNYLGKL